MSNAVLAQISMPDMLDAITGAVPYYLHLYTNDPELGDGMKKADFVEASHGSYSPTELNSWSPASISCGVAESTHDPVVYTYSTGPTPDPIQGLFISNGLTGEVIWAWRRGDPPFPLGPTAPTLTIILTMRFPIAA